MTNASVRPFFWAMTAATGLLITGCSNNAQGLDAGQRMTARGDAISARGDAWTNGRNDLQKGRKLVARSADRTRDSEKKLRRAQDTAAKAEQTLEVARADRANGEQLIANGTTQMQQAEAAYTEIRNGPAAIAPR